MKIIPILLCFALAVTGCQTNQQRAKKKKEAAEAAVKKRAKADLRDESSDTDFQAFVGRLRKAVQARDMNTIASMMTENFGYRLNPEGAGPGVFKYWDENNLWPELEGILSEKFVKKEDFMVAPPQFADPSLNYDGYRIGIRRVKGSWKFVYFVNG
ncbi:MAG: hypothetical protein QOI04_2146 [Verrucomicrobiota bacterium]|jgi:hypothetical protein